MTVSKRTRFEVLRRDDFACQYCGVKAPETGLTIDHVMPVALGGDDKPTNLVTACRECNSGKASILPESPLVAAVGDRAAAYALGMLDRLTRLRAGVEAADEYCLDFEAAWTGWHDDSGNTVPLPIDYESSIHRMGLPFRILEIAVKSAMALPFPKGEFGRFKYFCGVVWRQVDDSGLDYSLTTATAAVFTQYEYDHYGLECYEAGVESERGRRLGDLLADDLLIHHIDGTTRERVTDAA